MELTLDTVVVRNDKKFITSPIGEEIVMMSIESGNYVGMNHVATDIWNKLEKPSSVRDLVTYLLEIYDISRDTCESATFRHLANMLSHEMLQIQ